LKICSPAPTSPANAGPAATLKAIAPAAAACCLFCF